jgi:hypothetical protein
MCVWYSYVYRKGVLCFLNDECYIRSGKTYCFVRKYAAVPVQLEIVNLQYIDWCVLIIRATSAIIIIIISSSSSSSIIIIMSLVTDLFFLVILLNQQ